MKFTVGNKSWLVFLWMLILSFWTCEKEEAAVDFISYPDALRDSTVLENYHGTGVADPYRWLEDPTAALTRNWMDAQRSLTRRHLAAIPFRSVLRDSLEQAWDFTCHSTPVFQSGYFYFLKREGMHAVAGLYRTGNLFEAQYYQTVLEPNGLPDMGALTDYSVSKDGTLLAFELDRPGEALNTLYIYDLETKHRLLDTLPRVRSAQVTWYRDGFFYCRYPEPTDSSSWQPLEFPQVYYHRVGTSWEEDVLVFADRAAPLRRFELKLVGNGRYLLLEAHETHRRNALFLRDLQDPDGFFEMIVEDYRNEYDVVGQLGNRILLRTNREAPNGRLMTISPRRRGRRARREFLPESDRLLHKAFLVGDRVLAIYDREGAHEVLIYSGEGALLDTLQFPVAGKVANVLPGDSGNRAYCRFSSFLQPSTVYEIDLENGTLYPLWQPVPPLDPSHYTIRKVTYTTADGVELPMHLIHDRGLEAGADTPVLLFAPDERAEGGGPSYNRSGLQLLPLFLKLGGIGAFPRLRGGDASWPRSDRGGHKKTAIGDLQSAAEYLLENRYTSAEKLAAFGRGDGGLIVAAAVVQRPELFGVALSAYGLSDMLRYHQYLSGWYWEDLYGRSEDAEDFQALLAYSPIHQGVPARYPATLILTSDEPVAPAPVHAFKLAATLQYYQKGEAPVLIRIDRPANSGLHRKIEEGADVLAFLFFQLDHSPMEAEGLSSR